MPTFKCVGLPAGKGKLGLTNRIYVSEADFTKLQAGHPMQGGDAVTAESGLICLANDTAPYTVAPCDAVDDGCVALNMLQRMYLSLAMNDEVEVTVMAIPKRNFVLGAATLELSLLAAAPAVKAFDAPEVARKVKTEFARQVFAPGQNFAIIVDRTQVKVTVRDMAYLDLSSIKGGGGGASEGKGGDDDATGAGGASGGAGGAVSPSGPRPRSLSMPVTFGQLLKGTQLSVTKASGQKIKLTGDTGGGAGGGAGGGLFRNGFNFEKLGIGGLDEEFSIIFRRAFASRVYPKEIMKHMGIEHVRGMLLYGPPGCGKTLIARQIGKALNAREPKVVNGPEILNKYVGASEENIRKLFEDAEKEQEEAGDDSELHIIIFDEIDAICRQRGSSKDGTGVHDSIVNQLLSKINGVDSLQNILIIGMTNRKDLIDEAILRPGRLEVHVEIGLPNEAGRVQILNIHTSKMRAAGMLDDDVDIGALAAQSKNFTGAEIESLVKAASSYAMSKRIDPDALGAPGARIDFSGVKVTMTDFEQAFTEVVPAFGMEEEALTSYYRSGIINYGSPFTTLQASLRRMVKQVASSSKTSLLSVLLCGDTGTGKSAISAMAAVQSGYPFVKRIGADTLIGYSEQGKSGAIIEAFEKSYKSPLSLIVLDDIERLLEYVEIGPRFSNHILQTLLVKTKQPPTLKRQQGVDDDIDRVAQRKLLIIGTTSDPDVLDRLGLMSCFNMVLNVPSLDDPEYIRAVLNDEGDVPAGEVEAIVKGFAEHGTSVPMSRLLMTLEMARQETPTVTYESFSACAVETGLWK